MKMVPTDTLQQFTTRYSCPMSAVGDLTMGIPRRTQTTAPAVGKHENPDRSSALEENVQAIKRWESAILLARSQAEQVSDWIVSTAGSGPVLVLHVVWFGAWVILNAGAIHGLRPFDPFPYPFLTMAVSLEAIFLALFVLASQNRLARQADKRSHLDLQIDLLAEREMTAVLQLLQDIAAHLNVKATITPEQLRDLVKKTDIHTLAEKVEDFPDVATNAPAPDAERNTHPAEKK